LLSIVTLAPRDFIAARNLDPASRLQWLVLAHERLGWTARIWARMPGSGFDDCSGNSRPAGGEHAERSSGVGAPVLSIGVNWAESRTPGDAPDKDEGHGTRGRLPAGDRSAATFHQVYPAIATSVREVRVALNRFAGGLGLSTETRDAVTLAASEAATNVVVHAYAEQDLPGTIEVSATVAMDELWVIITDTGHGLRPRLDSPGLGLGLAIIAQLADGVDLVRPASGGLELRMRFALSREVAG
jgi:anti-sigma regulatory factor (Ser/Thr protein kinase)